MAAEWAVAELKFANLGDVRRQKRLVRMVCDLASQPHASVPQASGDWAATQAAYDFWASPRIKAEAIRQAHQRSTSERIKPHPIVLAIQDTTELNFSHHKSKVGMGYLDSATCQGLKVHSVFCSSAEGVPLGVLHQQVWAREPSNLGKKHSRHQKETKDKESQRWLSALEATENVMPQSTTVVTVADREADIYDFLALKRRENSELLIRAYHNRCVQNRDGKPEIERLETAIAQVAILGQLTLELRAHPEREARQATLNLRTTSLEILPPQNHPHHQDLQPLPVQVIQATEENPPLGVAPVSWLLFTTLPVTGLEDVVQCLRWYTYRWLIERYHYVLKSGCGLEQLQLKTADRIERALATYTIVAWRLLWMIYESRHHPDTPVDTILETHEWQALYCTIHSTPIPTQSPPTFSDCLSWIAKLGGFLGRKGDGEPGVKTLWRGLQRLHDIAATWQLVSTRSPPNVKPDFVKKDVSKA
jgi:hypothetical protein